MNCWICKEVVPLHAKYLEIAWVLACKLCDFRDEDWDGDQATDPPCLVKIAPNLQSIVWLEQRSKIGLSEKELQLRGRLPLWYADSKNLGSS